MKSTGFIYEWTDVKTGLKYIGKHKGTLDDGYICSSLILLEEYKKRPSDFVRQILWYSDHTSDSELCSIEYKYLSEIKKDEFLFEQNQKYYNQSNNGNDPYTNSLLKYGAENLKILKSQSMKNNKHGTGNKSKPKSEEHKRNISERIKEKYRNGEVVNNGKNGGRKPVVSFELTVEIYNKFGFVDGAKYFGISYEAFRSRYYLAKSKLTNSNLSV
jgi:hypothetical protein